MATDNCSPGGAGTLGRCWSVGASVMSLRQSGVDQSRSSASTRGHSLIGMCDLQQARFVEWTADELNPDGQPGLGEPTGHGDGW